MNQELLHAIRNLLKEELDPIRLDIADLKSDVAILKSDVADLKSDVAVLKSTTKRIDLLASESPGDVQAMLQIMDKKLDSIKSDVEFTYVKTSMNELEINRLKHQQ